MSRIVALLVAALLALPFLGPAPLAARTGAPGDGSITLRIYACGGGIPAGEIRAARCTPTANTPDLQLFILGSGENLRGIEDAEVVPGTTGEAFTWSGLPDGDYLLSALDLPPGFDRFYVAGMDGINSPPGEGYTGGPNEGYIVPISEASGRAWTLSLYLLREDLSADIGFRFWQCPPGVTAQPVMDTLGCKPVAPPAAFGIDLTELDQQSGDPTGAPPITLDLADLANPNRPIIRSLRPGPWDLSGTPPEDLFGFAMRSRDPGLTIVLKEDRSGYMLAVAPIAGGVRDVDVYLLAPPE